MKSKVFVFSFLLFFLSFCPTLTFAEETLSVNEQYQKAVNLYNETKVKFEALRKKSGCVTCGVSKKAQEELFELAKQRLLKTNEVLIKHLEVLKKQLEVHEKIDEEIKNNLLSEFEKDIAWLENQRSVIEDTNEKENLISYAATIRNYWLKVRWKTKKIVGHIISARVKIRYDKMTELISKVENKIAEAKNLGVDTDEAEKYLAEAKENLEKAKGNFALAVERFTQIGEDESYLILFAEGQTYLRKSASYIRQTHQALKNCVRSLKENLSGL